MRVLIFTENKNTARYLRKGLSELGHLVTVHEAGVSAATYIPFDRYDLLLVDSAADASIASVNLRELRAAGAKLPVIVVSSCGTVADRLGWFESGCDDCIARPFAFSELAARVSALERRQRNRYSSIIAYCGIVMDTHKRLVALDGRPVMLTHKEYMLLQTFLEAPERVFTKAELLDLCWGPDCGSSSNVVEVYVRYLRQKLGGGHNGPFFETIRGVGYTMRCGNRLQSDAPCTRAT